MFSQKDKGPKDNRKMKSKVKEMAIVIKFYTKEKLNHAGTVFAL